MMDLATTEALANVAAAFCGAVAAVYWVRASRAKVLVGEENDGTFSHAELIDVQRDGTRVNVIASARERNKLVGIGAIWGAGAAAAIVISKIVEIIADSPYMQQLLGFVDDRALNVVGLSFGLVGVIIVFRFGWPQPDLDPRNCLTLSGDQAIDVPTLKKRDQYYTYSSFGLGLIIAGFCFQLAAVV